MSKSFSERVQVRRAAVRGRSRRLRRRRASLTWRRWALSLAVLLFTGWGCDEGRCLRNTECLAGEVCRGGFCALAEDAGAPDAGVDAGEPMDGGAAMDAGEDVDAGGEADAGDGADAAMTDMDAGDETDGGMGDMDAGDDVDAAMADVDAGETDAGVDAGVDGGP